VFAFDGCKLASHASKEYIGTFEELKRKKKKLESVLAHLLAKHQNEDPRPTPLANKLG
jgi:hypothetical protein